MALRHQRRHSRRRSPLQRVAAREATLLHEEQALTKDATTLVKLEREAIATEKNDSAATQHSLATLEEHVSAATPQPLRHLTVHDIAKGGIGALIGIVLHFTFTYGVEIGEHLTLTRATVLLVVTFLIGGALLYGSGYRKITDKRLLWLFPYRLIVLYAVALGITTLTLLFFYEHLFADPSLAYRQIVTVNLSAVIGACTADLIGHT